MRLVVRSLWLSRVVAFLGISCSITCVSAAPVTGWLKDTSFGGGAAAELTAANTDSPILGDGAANNADNTAIYAPFPLVSLANGQRLTLSASAQMIGTSANPDFRWGLFENDGVGAATGGWLGYMASAESTIWSKDPNGSDFPNVTFASAAMGRGAVLGQTDEPNEISFSPGNYDFNMMVERYADEIDVKISITNQTSGFTIVSPAFTESTPSRLTFAFDRVGFLAGSALDADQIRFSDIDVTLSNIESPTLQVHSSGLVFLTNPTGQSVDLTQYEITSNAESLNPSGWTRFDSQENNDPIGSGWDEAGGNSGVLAEINLLSEATLDAGERHGLGQAFTATGVQDLAFHYTSEGEVRRGVVSYVQSGDYNHDGAVDAADYVVWRKTHGTTVPVGASSDGDGNGMIENLDYSVFRNNFGQSAGSGPGQAGVVPEPAAWVASLLAIPFLLQGTAARIRRSVR